MIETKPQFFDEFICIADRCSESCCIGWEIDIDEKTMRKYQNESGNLSVKLKRLTDKSNGSFILTDEERCPFLNKDNLCELILEKGADFLCDICREHPRFYEWYGNFTDKGLGLCCEEVARLLFTNTNPLEFVETETDEPSEYNEDSTEFEYVRSVRNKAIDITENRNKSFKERIKELVLYIQKQQYGESEISFKNQSEYFNSVLSSAEKTEPFDENFTLLINKLKEKKTDILLNQNLFSAYLNGRNCEYEKLLCYLLYRWLIKAVYDGDFVSRLNFSLGVTAITYYTDILCFIENGDFSFLDRINNVKYISKQFEYSDINPDVFARGLRVIK